MKYDEELLEIKNQLERAQSKRDTALGRMESLKIQKEKLTQEIIDAGSTPESLEDDIKSLENEINKLILECKELMPKDI
ncbi:hypothetical protein [Ezakiella peruensis]|uniref:hypothetical protein n=1 Tax=Ezakiella peruensis TaxID=1464038 RepID=UPI000C1B4DE1|nr:hypothetical protein [Ezakiella peruensis]